MSIKRPIVSIVIPTFNRWRSLNRTINALLRQESTSFEIIIVDDGSTDMTEEGIKNLKSKKIRYFRNKNNSGPAVSRNVGIKNAKGIYIGFVDDDCVPEKNWLSYLLSMIKKSDKKTAGVTGPVYAPSSGSFLTKAIYYLPYMDENTSIAFSKPSPLEVDNLSCTNSMWKKEVLKKLKGFNKDLRRGQDSELSFRAKKKGYKFLMYRKGKVTHHYRANLIDFLKTAYRTGKGSMLTHQIHNDYLKNIQLYIFAFPVLIALGIIQPLFLLTPLLLCTSGIKAYKKEKSILLFLSVTLLQFIKSYLNLLGMWKVLITRRF